MCPWVLVCAVGISEGLTAKPIDALSYTMDDPDTFLYTTQQTHHQHHHQCRCRRRRRPRSSSSMWPLYAMRQ